MCGTSVQTSDSAESVALQVSVVEGVFACHLHVLVAHAHLEDKRAVRLQAIVDATPVVVGTSGCMTGRVVRDLHKLVDRFSQVGFEEVSMYEGGDLLLQSLNIVQEGLLVLEFEVVLVGDPVQWSPHRRGDVWPSGAWIANSSFAASMQDLSIQAFSGLTPQQLADRIHLPTPLVLVCDWINSQLHF